jgi:ethanolamine utilization microcompartment shell protein EutS
MSELGNVVPLRFDMSDMVRQSIATLYSHLVTRPTGQALRLGIEAQIQEIGALCITVLDFSEVVVLDYSCADETVAKLIQRFQRSDRPAEAYFIARGVDDRHLETIESVLARQDLAIAAELAEGRTVLLGDVGDVEDAAWNALQRMGRGTADEIAATLDREREELVPALESLARRRVIVRMDIPRTYFALRPLVADPG